jgi:hypothetical protein
LQQLRQDTERQAQERMTAAEHRAREMVNAAEGKRRELEAVVDLLEQRRRDVAQALSQAARSLDATVEQVNSIGDGQRSQGQPEQPAGDAADSPRIEASQPQSA